MKLKNKILFGIFSLCIFLTSCATDTNKDKDETSSSNLDNISVVSREEGSGTRGAFSELVGLIDKDSEKDMTTNNAIVQNSTNGVLMTVSNDTSAIGYISLGSYNDKVKKIKVDGIEATDENIENEKYPLYRPFNIAYKENELNEISKDFIEFLDSKQAQKIVEDEGYISLKSDKDYKKADLSGKLTLAGSTSISPLMEKLKEEYENNNPNVKIEIQSTGSTAGIESTIEGISDIAMASRDLMPEEKKELKNKVIANDGITVIVNKENSIEEINLDQLKSIFNGEISSWKEMK